MGLTFYFVFIVNHTGIENIFSRSVSIRKRVSSIRINYVIGSNALVHIFIFHRTFKHVCFGTQIYPLNDDFSVSLSFWFSPAKRLAVWHYWKHCHWISLTRQKIIRTKGTNNHAIYTHTMFLVVFVVWYFEILSRLNYYRNRVVIDFSTYYVIYYISLLLLAITRVVGNDPL